MRKWLLLAATFFFGGVLVATEVEARRLGGGGSVGTQRNVTAPPAQTPAKPAQQTAAQGQQQGAAQAAPAGSRWGGILGGLLWRDVDFLHVYHEKGRRRRIEDDVVRLLGVGVVERAIGGLPAHDSDPFFPKARPITAPLKIGWLAMMS